jgi:hypothetical protein
MIAILTKLANKLDKLQHYTIANEVDSLLKNAEQLNNKYYPIGQKGDEYGGEADQDSEVAEEINEELEARDMEGYTPGTDNIIIDKMDSVPNLMANLKKMVILIDDQNMHDLFIKIANELSK